MSAIVVVVVGLTASVGFLWMLTRNLSAWRASRAMLDGRPGRPLAKIAWATSVFGAWTGPLVPVFSTLAIILGVAAGRGKKPTPRTRLYKTIAIENGVVTIVVTTLVFGVLYFGTRVG